MANGCFTGRGVYTHTSRVELFMTTFLAFALFFQFFNSKKKEENIRVYRNHCID